MNKFLKKQTSNSTAKRKIKVYSKTKKFRGGLSIFLTPDLTLPTSHFGGPIRNTYVVDTTKEEIFAICIIKLKSQEYELFPRKKIVCITRINVNKQEKYIMRARYLPWSLIISILCVGPRILHSGFKTIQTFWKKFQLKFHTKRQKNRLKSQSKRALGGVADEFTQGKKQGDHNYEKLLIQVIGTGLLIRFMSAFIPTIAILFMVCIFFNRVNSVSDNSYYLDVYRRFRFLSSSIDNANFKRNKKLVKNALDKLLLRKWNYETGNVVNRKFKETTKMSSLQIPLSFSNYFETGVSKITPGCVVQVCIINGGKRTWHQTTVNQVKCDNVIVVNKPDSVDGMYQIKSNVVTMYVPYHRIKLGSTLDEDDSKNTEHYTRTYNIGERVDVLIEDTQTQSEEAKWVECIITKEVYKCKDDTFKYSVVRSDTQKKLTVMDGIDTIRGFPGYTEQSVLQSWFNDAMKNSNGNIEIEKYISLNSPFRDELAIANGMDDDYNQ